MEGQLQVRHISTSTTDPAFPHGNQESSAQHCCQLLGKILLLNIYTVIPMYLGVHHNCFH